MSEKLVIIKTLFNEDEAHFWANMEASRHEEAEIEIKNINHAWRASVTFESVKQDAN